MNELLKGRYFQFWEYQVSHGSLLIRSPKKNDQTENIDILFFGTEFIMLPRYLKEISLSNVNDSEILYLESVTGKEVNRDRVHVLESNVGRYFVIASGIKIEVNEGDIFDSPFGYPIKDLKGSRC